MDSPHDTLLTGIFRKFTMLNLFFQKHHRCKDPYHYAHHDHHADMEKVKNLTQAGFFTSRFDPKVGEICQFQNIGISIRITNDVRLPRLGKVTQPG